MRSSDQVDQSPFWMRDRPCHAAAECVCYALLLRLRYSLPAHKSSSVQIYLSVISRWKNCNTLWNCQFCLRTVRERRLDNNSPEDHYGQWVKRGNALSQA
eukprot:scaffold308636_cov33-Prasinocladus_malaysianus.AAC.1